MENVYKYTIALLRFVLTGDRPDLTSNVNFEQLLEFSKSHGIVNMMYVGLRDLKISVPNSIMQGFEDEYKGSIVLEAKQAIELQFIEEAFERNKIDNIPLKGSVIKYLYPMPDYRKSADIDILIHPEQEDKIESLMLDLDYQHDDKFDKYEVHFAYKKSPDTEVEMHRMLLRQNHRSYKFFLDVWKYAKLKEGYLHQYELSDEYIYVHLMAHLAHHLYRGGVGIRHIIDFYVIRKQCKLNEDVLNKYLKKAHLKELDKIAVGLVKKWFGENYDDSPDVDALERLVFTSGSFGNYENKKIIRNSNTTVNKLKSFVKQVFPPIRELKLTYKILETKPYLIFGVWVYRWYKIVFYRRNTISEKIGDTFETTDKKTDLKKLINAIRDNR